MQQNLSVIQMFHARAALKIVKRSHNDLIIGTVLTVADAEYILSSYLTPYMESQNMDNIVSDLAPAQDQAIMLTNTDILLMAHCEQIQWHLNEITTVFIKENPKYCL